MIHVQNELKYRAAIGMLKKLTEDGLLTQDEFNVDHGVVAERYCPALSADCRGYSHGYVVSLLADKGKGGVSHAGSAHHRSRENAAA